VCCGRKFGRFTVSSVASGLVGGLFSFACMASVFFGMGMEVFEVFGRGSGVLGGFGVVGGHVLVVFGGFLGG